MNPNPFPFARRSVPTITRAALVCLLIAAIGAGAVLAKGPPSAQELVDRDGNPLTVLLLRVLIEVDGQPAEPFRNTVPVDNVSFGIGGFETGMGVKEVGARFLSKETRKEGWTYLLVRPGLHYLAVHEPISTNAFANNARWTTCPRWRIEIPADSRVHYAGTLFLPGKGRAMIFGPRQLVEFDTTRMEVRDDSVRAADLCHSFLHALVPMTIQLAKEQRPGDTMIIETPPEK